MLSFRGAYLICVSARNECEFYYFISFILCFSRSRWHCTKSFTICFITWAISRPCVRDFFFAHFIQWIEHIKREKEWERAISLLAVWGLCVGANAVCNIFSSKIVLTSLHSIPHQQPFIFNSICCAHFSHVIFVFFRTTKKVNSYANNNNNTELQNSLSNHNINIPNASNSFCFEKKLAYISPKQSIERNVSAAPTICMCHSNTLYVFYGLVPFVSPKFPTIDFEIYDQKEQENKKLVVKHSIYDWDFHD